MKAFVSGATGLVGSHLVENLLGRGDQVRALVRSATGHLQALGVELICGDVRDVRALREGARGADVIFHCAAVIQLPGDRADVSVNVEGTKNMLEAALSAGVKRFVFVSSVAVYGHPTSRLIFEDHPLSATDPYSASKIEGERLVLKYHREHGLNVSIIRPCVIYGPNDRSFLPRLIEALKGRVVPLVKRGQSLLDLVYASDVADALILAATNEKAVGQIYNITDGQATTIRELFETAAQILGIKPRLINVPYAVAYGAVWATHAASKMLRGSARLVNPSTIRASAIDHHYDITKARRELGYEPKVDLKQGLRNSLKQIK